MQISVSDAKAHLTELVRRAEAGEDIVLTRHGQPAARLAPIAAAQNRKARLAFLEAMRQEARTKAAIGPGGVPSWDFLFGADKLPE
jgi:prevent-host-death family protein